MAEDYPLYVKYPESREEYDQQFAPEKLAKYIAKNKAGNLADECLGYEPFLKLYAQLGYTLPTDAFQMMGQAMTRFPGFRQRAFELGLNFPRD